MKDKFMKNGVFSLEYDKETLKDMVLKLQNESQKQKEVIDKLELENKVLKEQMVAMVKPNYTYGIK